MVLERPGFDRLLADWVGKPGDPPGVIALVRTPSGTWRGAAGLADVAAARPMRSDDRFRIASVTKTFTATVVLQLVAEHKLGLDDTLAERLPGVFGQGGRITIRQLLDHTSGLPTNSAEEFPPWPEVIPQIQNAALRAEAQALLNRVARGEQIVGRPELWLAAAATQPLQFQPGTTFHYSNLDYEVLGKIVERLTGRSLTDEMQVRIFRPLGLDDTELRAGPAIDGPYAHGYDISGSAPVDVTMTATQPRENFAASNIVSTTDDLARFFHALQGGQLLPATLLAQMTTVFPTALDWTDIPSSGYGLGQIRYELPCGQAWGHGGGIDGFLTQVFADRRGQRIVVVAVTAGGTRPGQAKARLATEFYCRGR